AAARPRQSPVWRRHFKNPHTPITNTTATAEVTFCHAGAEVVGSKPTRAKAQTRRTSTTGPKGNEAMYATIVQPLFRCVASATAQRVATTRAYAHAAAGASRLRDSAIQQSSQADV